MHNLFIYEEGKKKGEVIADTKFLPESMEERDVIYLPLPPDMLHMIPSVEGRTDDVPSFKKVKCRKTELIVKDKRVWLCKED